MANKVWSWHDLFPAGTTAITAARRIGADTPVTAADWEVIRSRLYSQAKYFGHHREQIAAMDFANMARALVRDVERERAAYQGDRK